MDAAMELVYQDDERAIAAHLNMTAQAGRDRRIHELHAEAQSLAHRFEEVIDELKTTGPHSLDRDNALVNTRERLRQLANR